jgi:hypothetical protein
MAEFQKKGVVVTELITEDEDICASGRFLKQYIGKVNDPVVVKENKRSNYIMVTLRGGSTFDTDVKDNFSYHVFNPSENRVSKASKSSTRSIDVNSLSCSKEIVVGEFGDNSAFDSQVLRTASEFFKWCDAPPLYDRFDTMLMILVMMVIQFSSAVHRCMTIFWNGFDWRSAARVDSDYRLRRVQQK